MNIYSFCLYFFSAWTFFFGVFIYARRRDDIGRSWFVFAIFAGLWAVTWALMLDNRIPYDEALQLGRFSVAMGIMIPVTWFHFILRFLHKPNPRWLVGCLYPVSIVMAFTSMFTGLYIDKLFPYLQFEHHVHPGVMHFTLHSASRGWLI